MKEVSFKVSSKTAFFIRKIVKRAEELAIEQEETLDTLCLSMDITACHANGCPLDLAKLLKADNFNFIHDVWGIHRHINRITGKLEHCFLPRCNVKEAIAKEKDDDDAR